MTYVISPYGRTTVIKGVDSCLVKKNGRRAILFTPFSLT